MHPKGKGTQFCSNEGLHYFPRGDIEIAKIHLQNLKILFFSRTTVPISTKLDKGLLGEGAQV